MLSEENPAGARLIPKDIHAKSFEHYDENHLYEALEEAGDIKDEEKWTETLIENFTMEDYEDWLEYAEDQREEVLTNMPAYQTYDQIAEQLVQKTPTDQRNYLHVKIKRNPGHYAQTLSKTMQKEPFEEEDWFQSYVEGEMHYGYKPEIDQIVDTISAPTAKALYATDYQPVNQLDALLYQRERKVIDFTDYYMWRRTLEEEALVDAENNLSTYYETKIEDKRELTADELRRMRPEKAIVKKRKGDVEGRELLTQDEWEVQQQEHEMRLLGLDVTTDMELLNSNSPSTWAKLDREELRQMQDSVGPDKEWKKFDMPSLDIGRDLIYEEGRRLRTEVVFDEKAAEQVGLRSAAALLDPESEEKIYALSHMAPPDPEERVSNEYKELVEEEFGDYLRLERHLLESRSYVAAAFTLARKSYEQVLGLRQSLVQKTREELNAKFEYQPHPKPLDDILGKHQTTLKSRHNARQASRVTKLKHQMRKNRFNPSSRKVSDYERELLFLTKAALLTRDQDMRQKIEFVLECMRKQNIRHSPHIRARIFEYAVLSKQPQLANSILAKPLDSPIHQEYLKIFYQQSLRRDNLDGIAYLCNYCTERELPFEIFDLSAFHNALNYYLNVQPNISKVMIFTKFYCAYYNERQKKLLTNAKPLNEKQMQLAAKALFSENAGLVNMPQLFGYLVDYVGGEQMLDPQTKQDSLWQIVDLFTRDPSFYSVSQMSQNDTLQPEQLAKYLGSQLSRPLSIDLVVKVNRRLNQTSHKQQFTDQMLQELKEYQSKHNGTLPASFTTANLRQVYLKLKSLKQLDPQDEVLLYILKQANLNDLVIDYCTSTAKSEVTKYYLAEALLQMDKAKRKQYLKVLTDAGCINQEQMSACDITQGTKAVLLDRGAKQALEWFEKGYAQLKQQHQSKEDMLVSIYDSVFKSPQETSLKQFKQVYLRSSLVGLKVAAESYAVSQMAQVIQGKDYDQIEKLFSYYTLLNESKHLAKCDPENEEIQQRKQSCQERIKLMQHDLSRKDMEQLQNISKALKGEDIKIVNQQTPQIVHHYMEMFKGMTLEDVEAIRAKHESLKDDIHIPEDVPTEPVPDLLPEDWSGKLHNQSDEEFYDNKVPPSRFDQYADVEYDMRHRSEVNQVFADFQYCFAKTVNDISVAAKEPMGKPSEKNIMDMLESGQMRLMNRIRNDDLTAESAKDFDNIDLFQIEADDLVYNMKHAPLTAENTSLNDPEFLVGETFNKTMAEMKEHLLLALSKRKEEALPAAVSIFNKIQEKEFKVQKLDAFQKFQHPGQVENIDENLSKFRLLLDDPRSPILSGLLETEKYITQAPGDFYDGDNIKRFAKDTDYDNPMDMDKIKRDIKRLETLETDVGKIRLTLESIQEKLGDEYLKSSIKEKKHAMRFKDKQRAYIEQLYQQWQGQTTAEFVSREQKIAFMRNALSLQLGEQFTSSAFPTFYALDLISFGVQRKQPAAVRLGEKLLAEQGGRMPKALATEVRNYLLDASNQQQYRKAIKTAGAQAATSLYHQQSSDDQQQPIFSMDDPYWRDFIAKNARREDQWRTPSIYAWTHKPYGIIGEVVDTWHLRKQYEKYFQANK